MADRAKHFDAIVIGTGQGGAPLAVELGKSGRKTAVIERAAFGGTCVNVAARPRRLMWRARAPRMSYGTPPITACTWRVLSPSILPKSRRAKTA